MEEKVQFINSTGDFSSATQNAQKRLVRSHVATQRQRRRRQRDVEDHSQNTGGLPVSEQRIPPAASLRNAPDEVLLENNDGETVNETINPTTDTLERGSRPLPPILDNLEEQFTPTNLRTDSIHDVLRPVHEGGNLLPLPTTPSPYTYLGHGVRDWFVPMPLVKSHRMSKHLFYHVNVLMPKLHPSYPTNLVRRTYGCDMLRHADELTLVSTAAFSATSRALVSGDMEGTQRLYASNAFHEGAFDWLYFKGQTIRLINDKLDAGVDVTDASLVKGICSLIFMEVFTGRVNEAIAHLSGLRRIESLWHARGHEPPFAVASKIAAANIKISALTNEPPSIPFNLTFNIPIPQPLPGVSHLHPTLGTRLLQQWPAISSDDTFLPIIHDLTTMTRYTEAIYDWVFPYIENDAYMEYISYQNLRIEHRLLSFRAADVVDSACRTACLLYLNTVLVRGWPNNSAMIRNMVGSLREVLERRSARWNGLEEVLFWIAFIGTYCSHGPEDEVFFAKILQSTASKLSLASYEDASALLRGSLFVERVYGETLARIWHATTL